MSAVGVGIIGLGHIGSFHIQALSRFPELRLVAACDLDRTLSRLLPGGVAFAADADSLLRRSDLDTVIIATPNATHEALARSAFEAGKNVIMEKPAAVSMDGFEAVDALFAADNGLHIYYALHAAKAFDVTWFKAFRSRPGSARRLGPLTAFRCQFHDPYVADGGVVPEARGLGDSWIDSGVNALSVLAELLDLAALHPQETVRTRLPPGVVVQAMVAYRFAPFEARDSAETVGAAGGMGVISTSWTQGTNHKSTTLTFGTAGIEIVLDHSRQTVLEVGSDGEERVLQSCAEGEHRLLNHYIGVFTDYLDCRRVGTFNSSTARRVHDLLFRSAPLPDE